MLAVLFQFGLTHEQHDDALEPLNRLIGPDDIVRLERKHLIIEGYREGNLVKSDKVNRYDLDPAGVSYDGETKVVSVPCHSDLDDCVERKLLLDGQKNYRKRVAFGVKDDEQAAKLMDAWRNLLTQLQHK